MHVKVEDHFPFFLFFPSSLQRPVLKGPCPGPWFLHPRFPFTGLGPKSKPSPSSSFCLDKATRGAGLAFPPFLPPPFFSPLRARVTFFFFSKKKKDLRTFSRSLPRALPTLEQGTLSPLSHCLTGIRFAWRDTVPRPCHCSFFLFPDPKDTVVFFFFFFFQNGRQGPAFRFLFFGGQASLSSLSECSEGWSHAPPTLLR